MIILIGTGHVFDLSEALQHVFEEKQPDLICVELDQQRYQALLLRKNDPEAYQKARQNLPAIYKMLASFQENMAHQYGVQAGEEMLTAITYAQSYQIPVSFIDTDAQQLFTTMWRTMPFVEKLKLLFSGLTGFLISKKRVEQELSHYQQDFDSFIQEVAKKFPTIKKTLIDDRNVHMVKNLMTLHETHQRIIACIGDGHVPGMASLLAEKQMPFETIRLHELQAFKRKETDGVSARFSINYTQP